MYIGELARRAGTTPKAVRHYEALGLLGAVRRQGSYRVYDEAALRQVQLIRQALALGLRLADLLPALGVPGQAPDWQGMRVQIAQRRQLIRAEATRLMALDRQLGEIDAEIGRCLEGAVALVCEPATAA